MENQEYPNLDLSKKEETKECYKICDHEYTIKSKGLKICHLWIVLKAIFFSRNGLRFR